MLRSAYRSDKRRPAYVVDSGASLPAPVHVVCNDPATSCLRPTPATLVASDELGIRCGSTMVTTTFSANLLDYFSNGTQHYWVPLAPATTIDGGVSASANVGAFWTGISGLANPGWMVSQSGGLNRASTFATSYLDPSYNYCNASPNASSPISLSYR